MQENEHRMTVSCDGLISRFLIAASKPVRNELVRELPKFEGIKIRHFLIGIYIINKNLQIENDGADTKTPTFLICRCYI
jgi:hypothetical protein